MQRVGHNWCDLAQNIPKPVSSLPLHSSEWIASFRVRRCVFKSWLPISVTPGRSHCLVKWCYTSFLSLHIVTGRIKWIIGLIIVIKLCVIVKEKEDVFFLNLILFFNFTILYWFCCISTWIHHRYTRVSHPEPSSLLPPRTIPLGHPSAPAPSIQYRASNLDWRLISYMIYLLNLEMFTTLGEIYISFLRCDFKY